MFDSLGSCLKTKSTVGPQLAARYVSGLLSQTTRKNMERIDERLAWELQDKVEDSYQAMQQFVSASPWDERPLYTRIAQRANERLGNSPDSVLIIDEEANAKKGNASVGVARQWNGRLGKEDNCQVGVFSVLNSGTHTALVGARLFLPEAWSKDPERCRKAGVPEERIEQGYRTKIDHARELIEQALSDGIKFGCVTFDSFYGRDTGLRRFMEEKGLIYCADTPANTRVFETKPKTSQRPKQISAVTVRVDELAKAMSQDKNEVTTIALRKGDAGEVKARVRARRVWEWSAQAEQAQELWIITREMPDGSTKISLSNAPAATAIKRLARWQGARFWVERCFQDAKSHCGLAQYQSRGWRAWHHHMALVSLAILFTMEERMREDAPTTELTCADVVELMEWLLVDRPTAAQLIDRIEERHRKRRAAAASALKRQRKRARAGATS